MPHLCIKPPPTSSTVWAVARKDGRLIASTVRQPDLDDILQYDEIWPEWAPHALHEFMLKAPATAESPARPFGTLLCQHGACYPAESHTPSCTAWTPDQVRAAGGKFLDKLPIGF